MAKSFKTLREKMSPERRARSAARAQVMLAEIALQDLRKSLNLTQEEIAKVLETKQATISRLEAQDDMYISTLNRFVIALGGKLKLVASFKDKEIVINQFDFQKD